MPQAISSGGDNTYVECFNHNSVSQYWPAMKISPV